MLNVKFASEADPETDVSLSFFAAERILGEVIFSERFIFDVGRLIQEKRYYHLNETLRDVRLPSGQDLGGQFVFIVAKSLKENLDFGVLFRRMESGGYHIVGLWPRDFAEICRTDAEIFEFLMFRLVNTPDFFSKVSLYQPLEMKMPKMEVKPPAIEMKPPVAAPIPAIPAAATEVKAAVKPAGVEITAPSAPAKAVAPPAVVEEVPSDLMEGRCPFCKAAIPEPRLKVLQRGSNTFCPKCLKILKGFKAPVAVTPVSEEPISVQTKRELTELVSQADQSAQAKNYDLAASQYRQAAQKASLLDDTGYAKQLEGKAEASMLNFRKIKIQGIMKSADDYFRQKSYDDAIKEYKIAIDLAKKINDSEMLKSINTRIRKCAELIVTDKIEGFINTGDQLFKEERYDEAKQNYVQALELERKLGEQEIITLLEQKVSDCESVPLKNKLKEASSKAEKQFKIDRFEEAEQYYREAAVIASQLGDADAQRFFEQKIQECRYGPAMKQIQEIMTSANAQLQSKDYGSAAGSYKNALNLANQIANQPLINELQQKIKVCDTEVKISATLQNAESNFQSQNLETALSYYREVVKLGQSVNDAESINKAESRIKEVQNAIFGRSLAEFMSKADILLSEQKFDEAIQKFVQARQLATKINDSAKLQEISTKITQCEAAAQKAAAAAAVPTPAPAPARAPTPAPAPARAPTPAPAPAAPGAKPGIEPTGFLCPFCDFPLPEKTVKNLKKGYNAPCPNCNKILGRRALEL
ncbi:MAG: hypothetical protein HWN65_20860 [Candidatus Helarchaeota archaeon]|nr:hypothetical protein [Candidatus Helarchaeota archaeon]